MARCSTVTIPAAPAGPFVMTRSEAPRDPIATSQSVASPQSVATSQSVAAPRSLRSDDTRIGVPLPPAVRSPPPSATVICENPLLLDPRDARGTVVVLAPPPPSEVVTRPPGGGTTDGGTVIALNPLLLVPSAELGMPLPLAEAPTEAMPMPARRPGAMAVFLGKIGSDDRDDRDPIYVPEGESLEVGRKRGSAFARDPFVARYHAALIPSPEGILVEDFGTANGVYVRVDRRMSLRDDDRIRVGQQLLRFQTLTTNTEDSDGVRRIGSPDPGAWGRVGIMLDPWREAAAYPLRARKVELGQQTGDIQFPGDRSVGEPHCRLCLDADDSPHIESDADAPPTYVKLERGDLVAYGSELLIGETRVRLDPAG